MKLHWTNPCGKDVRRSIALGTFDGVHVGHQALLRNTVIHKPDNGCSAVFTFDYPPKQVLQQSSRLIVDFNTRQKLILEQGIDEIVWVEFSPEVARVSAKEFVQEVLVQTLNAAHVTCGFNYRFGYKAEGTPELLKQLGLIHDFSVDIVPPYNLNHGVVSSSRIRQAINAGNISCAAELLGRFPRYSGIVSHGAKRGRKLGFPTANLVINPEIILPHDGVYLTWCYLQDGRNHPAITAVGKKPTYNDESRTVEAFLLNFKDDLYGQTVEIEFLQFLRGIQRFADSNQLKQQIAQDMQVAQTHLSSYRLQDGRVVLK